MIAHLDPLNTTALESLDFGSVYSPDGREHPVNAQTPVATTEAASPAAQVSTNPLPGWMQWLAWLLGDSHTPSPEFAMFRLIAIVVGIGLVFIVAFRLTK